MIGITPRVIPALEIFDNWLCSRILATGFSTDGLHVVAGTKRIVRVAAGDLETPPEEPLVMARDDDVLPDNLLDSVVQAGEATAAALKAVCPIIASELESCK